MVWWFPSTGGARRGAFPLDPMEYVFTEGIASPYDVMYDTVHALPATPILAAQSEAAEASFYHRVLVRTSDGIIYVIYRKLLAGQYQIFVIRSVDNGATWVDDTHISTGVLGMNTSPQFSSSIAVDSNDNLHVIWYGLATGFAGTQIWYALYDGSWQTPIRISTAANMTNITQGHPAIAVDSNDNLHVVWQGGASDFVASQIRYATAVPPYAAVNWVAPIRISTYANMAANAQQPSTIAVDSNNYLHVIWFGQATGFAANQIWYALYDGSWHTPIRISTYANMATNHQDSTSIAVDSNDNLHVVWRGKATGFTITTQIWYATAVSPYAAGDWVTPIRISTTANMAINRQEEPCIAVDSNDNLYVVWRGMATGYFTNVVWLAVYIVAWATPECIQPTNWNRYPILRWSRWPR